MSDGHTPGEQTPSGRDAQSAPPDASAPQQEPRGLPPRVVRPQSPADAAPLNAGAEGGDTASQQPEAFQQQGASQQSDASQQSEASQQPGASQQPDAAQQSGASQPDQQSWSLLQSEPWEQQLDEPWQSQPDQQLGSASPQQWAQPDQQLGDAAAQPWAQPDQQLGAAPLQPWAQQPDQQWAQQTSPQQPDQQWSQQPDQPWQSQPDQQWAQQQAPFQQPQQPWEQQPPHQPWQQQPWQQPDQQWSPQSDQQPWQQSDQQQWSPQPDQQQADQQQPWQQPVPQPGVDGYGPGPGSGQPPTAVDPERRRVRKRRWIGALVVVVAAVLVGAGFVSYAILDSSKFGAEAKARTYLQAIVDGDVSQVTSLYDPNATSAQRALLSEDIVKASSQRPSAFQISETEFRDDTATVTAQLTLDAKSYPVTIQLKKDGRQAVVFDEWKITDGGLNAVSVDSPGAVAQVNGIDVQLDGADWLPALPGTYTFTPQKSGQYVTFGDPVTVTVTPTGTASDTEVSFTESWTQQGREYALNQVQQRIASALRSDRFEPQDAKALSLNDPGSYAVTGITRRWSNQPTLTFRVGTVPSSAGADSGSSSSGNSSGSGRSGSSGSSGTAAANANATSGYVLVTGGNLHIDYQWRSSDTDTWRPTSTVRNNVFGTQGIAVPVTVGEDGTPQLDFTGF